MTNPSRYFSVGESLLTLLFTFFLISIRLNSSKPWSYMRTEFKSWVSWLTSASCAIFSSLQAILKEISLNQPSKTARLLRRKKLMSHTCFVKFGVFKREFLRNHLVYQAQIFSDNWNCYALSIFEGFILLAPSKNDEHYVNEAKNVNKDSPKQTTLPFSVF